MLKASRAGAQKGHCRPPTDTKGLSDSRSCSDHLPQRNHVAITTSWNPTFERMSHKYRIKSSSAARLWMSNKQLQKSLKRSVDLQKLAPREPRGREGVRREAARAATSLGRLQTILKWEQRGQELTHTAGCGRRRKRTVACTGGGGGGGGTVARIVTVWVHATSHSAVADPKRVPSVAPGSGRR